MPDAQFSKLAGGSVDRVLMAIRAGPCVVNGTESRTYIFVFLVGLLVEGIGVAWRLGNSVALAL